MPPDLLQHDLSVVAGALATALGPDLTTACAAARAGLSRARDLDHQPMRSEADGSVTYVAGHVVDAVTSGLEGEVRLVELGAWALRDLLEHVPEADRRRAGLFVALPPPERCESGSALIAEGDEPRIRRGGEIDAERVLARLAQREGLNPVVSEAVTNGHAGFGHAIRRAALALERGAVDVALVGAIDSLLEPRTLEWLRATARLKTPNDSGGVAPGEAAAFFDVRPGGGRTDMFGRSALSVTLSVVADEEETLLCGGRPLGRALTGVLNAISERAERAGTAPLTFYCDQNGERFRAQEWGTALARAFAAHASIGEATCALPAIDHGDTGAASGGVALATAFARRSRSRAIPDAMAIVGCSDAEARSGVLLTSGRP